MFIIGVNPKGGLFTKTQFQRGDIPAIGTRGQWTEPNDGSTKEFVSVKFTAGATHVNGSLVTISSIHVATLGTVGAGPALTAAGGRVGLLQFASATATQTMPGTAFGWAQIYGAAKALTTASLAAGLALGLGANGFVIAGVAGSASAAISGMNVIAATGTNTQLIDVFLNYPKFEGIPA